MPLNKVTADSIADGTVIAADIANGAVTGPKLGLTAINANNIVGGAVTGDKIGATSINANNIVNATITGVKIATGQITGNLLTSNCVAGNNIVSSPTITGNVTINGSLGVGGATPAASGFGITFPGTQVASTDANTLDDYEEGTWTPTVTASSGSLTAYSSSGIYVKVGRFVQVVGVFTIDNSGTAGGYGTYGGLPFTAVGPSGAFRDALGIAREDGATGIFYQVQVGPSSGAFRISTTADGTITWTTGYEYIFTMTYQTD